MRRLSKVSLGILGLLAILSTKSAAFAAGPEADFKTAYAAAEAAEKQAGVLRNQWLPTETALADARKAAEKSDFDRAVAAAKEAEALAKASIFQANSEKEAWKNLEIR
ncbi:hypothetical protein [Bradyrhizobium sp.]|uniref:hypothetical protein n=1 Tax=Bradyrhizobium sp. TaxID=376 RepID=UPI002639E0FC|nr:hypothetical protein [Bradyrhizobium sp.]